MADLSPPPPDAGSLPRWLQQFWDTVRGNSNLDSTRGTVVATDATQTLTNKTLTNLKDNTRAYAVAQGASQVLGVGISIINFSTVVLDSRSGITTGAAWKYTVQTGHAGIYLVSACVLLGAATGHMYLNVFKNGGNAALLGSGTSNATPNGVSGAALVNLAAGDYIDIRANTSVGGTLSAVGADNNVNIVRLLTDL